MNPDIPVVPGRVPGSLLDQEAALAEFEKQRAAYAQSIAAGGVDLSEPRPVSLDSPLSSLGITNRESARRAGIHTRRQASKDGAVPMGPKRNKKRAKAAKLARRKNR
jgi:hypothetical protein